MRPETCLTPYVGPQVARAPMVGTCLLSFVILVSADTKLRDPRVTGDRPALRLVASRTQLAQGQGAGWLSALTEAPAWAQHDYANLVLLPLLSGLTLAALRTKRAHLPLATLLLAYMALDALWMVAQPSVVKATQPVEIAIALCPPKPLGAAL